MPGERRIVGLLLGAACFAVAISIASCERSHLMVSVRPSDDKLGQLAEDDASCVVLASNLRPRPWLSFPPRLKGRFVPLEYGAEVRIRDTLDVESGRLVEKNTGRIYRIEILSGNLKGRTGCVYTQVIQPSNRLEAPP